MVGYEPPIDRTLASKKRKFEKEEVWELRRLVNEGRTISSLAREYNTSRITISAAIKGVGAYEGV